MWIQTYEHRYLNWNKVVTIEETESENCKGSFDELYAIMENGDRVLIGPCASEKEYFDEEGELCYRLYLMSEQEIFIQAMINIFCDSNEKQPILLDYWHEKARAVIDRRIDFG